jgi:hypothetical protein
VYKGDLGEGGRTGSLVGGAGISPRVTGTSGDGSKVCNEALWHDADMARWIKAATVRRRARNRVPGVEFDDLDCAITGLGRSLRGFRSLIVRHRGRRAQ